MAAKGKRILYQGVADAIRQQIAGGKLAPGDQVGSSLGALAQHHHVGVGTIRAALVVLADEGLVETIPGKGTFVLAAPGWPAGRPGPQDDAVLQRLEAVEVDIMELYARLGYEHRSQQGQRDRKARHEQAG